MTRACVALLGFALAACGGATRPSPSVAPSPPPAAVPCQPVPEASTQQGNFALDHDASTVRVYRLERDCARPLATIEINGTIAFVFLGGEEHEDVPSIGIETWLMHGDRIYRNFVWAGDRYVQHGRDVEIPGRRR